MKRKFLATFLLFVIPLYVHALGLGEIELNSGLNQPFDARIRLLSPTAADLDSLKVELADSDAFRRAEIDRPFILSKLKFEIEVNESGPDYIRVTSRDSIREPFLNFLVEANWSNGRLFREYTVLLDPPLYNPNARTITESPSVITPTIDEESAYEPEEETKPPVLSTPAIVSGTYSEDEYGPTVSGATLWSIASQTRPDSSISIQQMMMALLKTNPEAFINNNINGLKQGQILRIPGQDEISSLSKSEALNQVKSQYAAWDELRGTVAATTPQQPVSTTAKTEEVPAVEPSIGEDESELRLVAPSEEGAGEEQGVSGPVTDEKLRNQLALANEQLTALTAENAELDDQLTEAETIIADLKRLIELKDDELAKLQEQLAMAPSSEEGMESEDTDMEEEAATAAGTEDTGEPESAAEEAAPEEEPEPVTPEPVVTPPVGIVDQVMSFVMSNLLVIGGALGGLILVVVILVVLRKRQGSGGDEAVAVSTEEFPDFASEAETEIPGGASEDVTDIKIPEEGEAEAVPEEEGAEEEATVFIEQAEQEESPELPAEEVAMAEEPEEDPLAEVNVFLAYEHFDQAEEFVRDAIAKEPDNLEFHSKLLEVFYAAGDKAKYEEAAKVLHEKVNGEGPHWEMALAMWQELSPNRGLFETPVAGEEDEKAETTGGGIVDLTADEAESGGSIDFDLGSDTVAERPEEEEEVDVLDITAGAEEAPSSLDLTAATGSSSDSNEEILDLTAAASVDESSEDDDVLDVTAAVGLDIDESENKEPGDDDLLNITGGENVAEAEDDGVLDITGSGISGDDLLDVTSHHGNFKDEEIEEDLLDVTSTMRAKADSEDLLEVGSDDNVVETEEKSEEEDNTLDFDIGGLEEEVSVPPSEEKTQEVSLSDDNVIDFDMAAGSDSDEGGIELDLSSDDEGDEVGDIGLDADLSIGDSGEENEEISLDAVHLEEDDGSNDMDFGLTFDDETSSESEESANGEDSGIGLDFEMDTSEKQDDGAPEIDMDSTVEIPSSSLKLAVGDDEDDDDEEDSTVFVPRSSAAQEQSMDDEIATKLDLAKAYVELGDKDSAKSILDEVISAGNDEQKKIAQDLMGQMS